MRAGGFVCRIGGSTVEFFTFVITLAGLIAVGWVIQKIGGAALVGANRVVFHGEFTEGKHLREGRTFRTTASIPDIVRELDTYVCAVDAALGMGDVLYVLNKTTRGVAWVYGHGSKVLLEAIVALVPTADGTEAIFTVTRWHEEDGLEAATDVLKTLRMQVEAAFRAADADVNIVEGAIDAVEMARFKGAFAPASVSNTAALTLEEADGR